MIKCSVGISISEACGILMGLHFIKLNLTSVTVSMETLLLPGENCQNPNVLKKS